MRIKSFSERLATASGLVAVTLAALFAQIPAIAQTRQVTGRVTTADGEPVIAAGVAVAGTTAGTVTGNDGTYMLQGLKPTDILEFSSLGYATQTVQVGSQTVINVVLEEDADYLDEVVVIGYGTVKRRDLTGSVASVSGEKISQNPVTDVAQALQGALPGVSVTTQDGRPGANVDIRVRGGNSPTQSNSPLFVLDGVIVSSIDDIPADNISSIDVLKDAASTAIYGARGSNGVIMITTKNATEQKATVKYNGYYQVKTPASRLHTLNAQEYVYASWAYMTAYADNYGDGVARYFGLGSKYGNHYAEYANVAVHDWFDDIIQTASAWNHDISVSGGSDKTKFYATLGYNKDQGIRIESGSERLSANVKVDQWISSKLKLALDLRYADIERFGARYDLASTAYRFRPIDKPLGEDNPGLLMQGESNINMVYNPLDIIHDEANVTNIQRLRGNGSLTWNIIEGLTAKSDLSVSRSWNQNKSWKGEIQDGYSSATLNRGNGSDMRWSTTLSYDVQGLGKDHAVNLLAGYEVLQTSWQNVYLHGAGYPSGYTMDQCIGMFNMTNPSLAQDSFSNTIDIPTHTQSWFGRANYSYKGRYLFTATFRADGSSKFSPANHWGYFPAAAFAWRVSDEPFMKGAQSWLDNLKIRLSYGTAGADNISPALWKETWRTSAITVDGQTQTSFVPNSLLGNPDLKWETTTSRNLGIDYGLFKGRLYGSVDFYLNTTKDILMRVPIDNSTGYAYQYQNVGQTSNRGLDLALGADLVRGRDFNLSFGMTYNFNKNRVDALPDGILADVRSSWNSGMLRPGYDWLIRVGEPVGLINGFISEGFYGVDDFDIVDNQYVLKSGIPDIDNSLVQYAVPKNADGTPIKPSAQNAFPGVFKFKDVNEDGRLSVEDATIIGRTQPHHTGGFNFNGRWMNFDFSAAFTYQIGGCIYNVNAMFSEMGNKDNSLGMNKLDFLREGFRIYDVNAAGDLEAVMDKDKLRAMNANAKYGLPWSEYGHVTSDFVEDASYLRLQNLTMGYTLPKKLTSKVGVSRARIYATGYNLFVLTGYSGLDPEVNTQPGGADGFPTPNYDYRAYPKARTFTFGVSVTF